MTTTDDRTADRIADLVLQAEYADAALKLARMALGTAFIPDSLKVWIDPDKAKGDDPDKSLDNTDLEATANQVALAIVKGTGLGFRWTEALEAVVVINNRPFLVALALRALVQRTPYLRLEVTETTAQKAVVTGWRRDDEGDWGNPQQSVWTWDRARAAQLRGFGNPNGMWRKMPQNMLLARATGDGARYIGADVVLGIPYVAEEADSFGEFDGENPPDGYPNAAPPGTPALTAGAAASRTAGRAKRRPPPPPGAGTDRPPADPPAPATGDAAPSTDDQRTEIYAGLSSLGIAKAAEQRAQVNRWLDTDAHNKIGRLTELTVGQARQVLARIDAERRAKAGAEGGPDNTPDANGPGRNEDGGGEPAGGEHTGPAAGTPADGGEQ